MLCAAERAARVHRQAGARAGHRAGFRLRGARRKQDITTFPAVRAAARQAYDMAGVGPKDIQFAEVHDCFTIAEIIASKIWDSWSAGVGGSFSAKGGTRRGGPMPVNASGGLKSKGHPVGATGVAQICDVVQQMRAKPATASWRGIPWAWRRIWGQRRHLRGDDSGALG